MRQTTIIEGGSTYLVLEEGIRGLVKNNDLVEISHPFFKRPRRGEVRVIEGKLYYCVMEKYSYDLDSCAPLWRQVSEYCLVEKE